MDRQKLASEVPEIITENIRCCQIVSQLESNEIIALDAEGVNLGKDGPLTLLQIATPDHRVYLFDIHTTRSLFEEGKLKNVLESKDIVKVIHSCSGDSAALFHQFGIRLQNVFDTQVAHLVIQEKNGRKLATPAKLAAICELYSETAQVSDQKDPLKDKWTKREGELWTKRPLTKEMVEYAAGDVTALVPIVYNKQKKILEDSGGMDEFRQRVQDEVDVYIDEDVIRRRNKRVDRIVDSIISNFECKYGTQIKLEDIEDEDDIKAIHMIRHDRPGLTPLVKRLKIEDMKARLKEIRDQLSAEGDNFIPKAKSYGFLRAYAHIPQQAISNEAKQLEKELNRIFLKDISRKYTTSTKVSVIKQHERDVLKSLRPANEHDGDPVQLSLHWQMQEEDLDSTIAQFASCKTRGDVDKYIIPEGKYKWLKYLRSAPVPKDLKQKAKQHLDNLDQSFGKGKCPFIKKQ